MSTHQVLVSYAAEDREPALNIIQLLKKANFTVYDAYATYTEDFQTEVKREFETAECIVILWSKAASQSEFLTRLAIQVWASDRLVLARFDDAVLPVGLRDIPTVQVRSAGKKTAKALLLEIESVLSRKQSASKSKKPQRALSPNQLVRRRRDLIITTAVSLFGGAVIAGIWLYLPHNAGVPSQYIKEPPLEFDERLRSNNLPSLMGIAPAPVTPPASPEKCLRSSRSGEAEFCPPSPADSGIAAESTTIIPKSKTQTGTPQVQNTKTQERIPSELKNATTVDQAIRESKSSDQKVSTAPVRILTEPQSFAWQIIVFLLLLLAVGTGVALLWVWIAWSRKASKQASVAPSPVKLAGSESASCPQIFVSYCRQDSTTVETLVRQIEELGYAVWIDRQLSGSQRYAAPIVQALRLSRLVALMCSRNAFASDHVIREIYLAGDYKKPFIAFQLDSTAEFPDEVHYFLSGFPRLPVKNMDEQKLRLEIARFVSMPASVRAE